MFNKKKMSKAAKCKKPFILFIKFLLRIFIHQWLPFEKIGQ